MASMKPWTFLDGDLCDRRLTSRNQGIPCELWAIACCAICREALCPAHISVHRHLHMINAMALNQQHRLVKAVAKAALDAGMDVHSRKFRVFYETVDRLVLAYDESRTTTIEQLMNVAIDREMVTLRPAFIKEAPCAD